MSDIQEQIDFMRVSSAGKFDEMADTMEKLHETLVKIANDPSPKCVHVGAAREALLGLSDR